MEAKKGLVMKERLESLCCSNGWSYAVFWSFDQRNFMLLTAENVYCEQQMQPIIKDNLLQVQVLGEGLVGQVASTRTSKWVLADVNQGLLQENSEIFRQFSCGVKTIAAIFVESRGVLQLGSSQKILKNMEFVNQIRNLFKEVQDSGDTFPVNPNSSSENYDFNEWFASFCNGNITPMDGGSCNELMEISMNLMQPCAFASDLRQEGLIPSSLVSYSPLDQSHLQVSEAQAIASDEFGDSVLTSLPSQWLSNFGFCDSPKLLPGKRSFPATCSSQDESTVSSLDNSGRFINTGRTTVQEIPEKLSSSCSASSGPPGKQNQVRNPEQLKPDDLLADRSNTRVIDNLFESFCSSVSSGMAGHASASVQSTITETYTQDDTLEALALGFCSWKPRNSCENTTIPGAGFLQNIADMNISSLVSPRKALFSELGIEELVNGTTGSDTELSATKRRRVDDGKYGICHGNSGQAKAKKPEETAKTTRKRARPGESTRPRPKDRQQIQDRLKELKGIIPGGEKCSIDALLDRTIKHMMFLQSVTKFAEKLKQADESKDSRMKLTNNGNGGCGSRGGATWALEVGDQTAVCPIRIEDIGSSGLMLIEMLCDDRGFFLELADVIRSFGLNIIKGTMEIRDDKILARFIVEAHTNMTRMEIFWSLLELIQQTTNSGLESKNPIKDPPLNEFSQHQFANPIGLTEALQ